MSENTSSTPLWLEIKTEYLDQNFEQVISYLFKGARDKESRDSFYEKTIDLLGKRVAALLDEIALRPVFFDTESAGIDGAFETRMLGAFVLVKAQSEEPMFRRAYVSMMSCLSKLVSTDYEYKLLESSVAFVLGRITRKLPFTWDDIIDFNPHILAHKIAASSDISDAFAYNIWFEKKGVLTIEEGVMGIASMNREAYSSMTLIPSISILDGQIQIQTLKSNKVKKSESASIERLDSFTKDFILDQRAVSIVKNKSLKSYSIGDSAEVRVAGIKNGHLFVESTDKEFETFSGVVDYRQPLLYFNESDFIKNLPINEILRVKITGNRSCSIDEEFIHYIIDERAEFGKTILAKYYTTTTDRKGVVKIVWWTEQGFPAYSIMDDRYQRGDYADIKLLNHGVNQYYGYINCQIMDSSEDYFDENLSREECISGFSFGSFEPEEDNEDTLSAGTIKEIYRMLVSCQKLLPQPSERFKMLCVSRIMAELIGDSRDSGYIKFLSKYLNSLVYFAKGEYDKINLPVPDPEYYDLEQVRQRTKVIEILKEYGKEGESDNLSSLIEGETDPLIKKVAILVQSCNRIDDVISRFMQNVIKREITRCLSVEMEGETDLEEENGIYLGIENGMQEFKTSFFIAPANAKEKNQKLTIFKGICAFLNSQSGGTLYLGVDDLGYVKGVGNDIDFMERTVNGNYHGMDGYIRYITDEAKKYFDISILTHVQISSMYDDQVVALVVRPYEYSVVELDGVAYVRLNSESVVMSDTLKRQLLAKRVILNRGKVSNINSIKEAINNKRKAVFHGYDSNTSKKRDRNVEPFEINDTMTHVWCYDLDKMVNHVFRVDRISNVEVCKERWEHEKDHHPEQMDIFHMTGNDPIHVTLQLDTMAKNLLLEEFPEAKSCISSTRDDNTWILDTNVYSLKGIGRFYIGLAANIVIIDAPGLKEYASEYAKKNL